MIKEYTKTCTECQRPFITTNVYQTICDECEEELALTEDEEDEEETL